MGRPSQENTRRDGGGGGELDTDPWKDGGDDKHRTVSTGPRSIAGSGTVEGVLSPMAECKPFRARKVVGIPSRWKNLKGTTSGAEFLCH